MLGSNLTRMPPELEAMLTNRAWLAVNQAGSHPRRVLEQNGTIVWRSDAAGDSRTQGGSYLAVFNTADATQNVRLPWSAISLSGASHRMRDLWSGKNLTASPELSVTLPAHGAALYLVQ